MEVDSSQGKGFFKQALSSNSKMTLEEAIFRSEVAFKSTNLQECTCRQFWEEEILKEHPQKTTLLNWIEGVKIEEFLRENPTTGREFWTFFTEREIPKSSARIRPYGGERKTLASRGHCPRNPQCVHPVSQFLIGF